MITAQIQHWQVIGNRILFLKEMLNAVNVVVRTIDGHDA